MIQIAKNEVFGHFLEFGGSDLLDIAYDGSPKSFSTYSSGYRSYTANQLCIMCINGAKKSQKLGFSHYMENHSWDMHETAPEYSLDDTH